MDEKILLSSYVVKIKDLDKVYHNLSHIDGSVDFINLFQDFTNEIFTTIQKSSDIKGLHTTHLTLDEPIKHDNEDARRLYGFFSSGVSGEKYKVVDTTTNEKELEVEPHHAAFRNVFFYLYIPPLKSTGYLILQRKAQFGIKLRLNSALNKYLQDKGLHRFRLELNNVIHNKVYRKMMDEGRLKRVELIKNKIPRSIEKFMENNEELEQIKGTFKSSFTSRTSLPDTWKSYIDGLFKQRNSQNGTVEIQGLDNDYDDLEFELELNGKKKTFYMVNQQRIQPDVDITNNVEFKEGEPTVESLIQQAKELIEDITQIMPR
jgi:hypothetical protein